MWYMMCDKTINLYALNIAHGLAQYIVHCIIKKYQKWRKGMHDQLTIMTTSSSLNAYILQSFKRLVFSTVSDTNASVKITLYIWTCIKWETSHKSVLVY
jgi:hypothetical protein